MATFGPRSVRDGTVVEHQRQLYRAEVAAHVDEPVEAVGVCADAGGRGDLLVAVTPTRLVAVATKRRGLALVATGVVDEWPRPGLQAAAGAVRRFLQPVVLRLADGTIVELQVRHGIGVGATLNDPFLAALGAG